MSISTIHRLLFPLLFCFLLSTQLVRSQEEKNTTTPELQNPINVQYLQKKLKKTGPKLVLNAKIEKNLKKKLKTDPVVQNLYKAIKANAAEIQKKPLLLRELEGRRLLHVSREMLYRMNMLGMVYRIEKDPVMLSRINEEIKAVCNFSDWNPSHYLDVAEMSMALPLELIGPETHYLPPLLKWPRLP